MLFGLFDRKTKTNISDFLYKSIKIEAYLNLKFGLIKKYLVDTNFNKF